MIRPLAFTLAALLALPAAAQDHGAHAGHDMPLIIMGHDAHAGHAMQEAEIAWMRAWLAEHGAP